MNLETYSSKRNFKISPEPRGKRKKTKNNLKYAIQEHHASHLHFDFRLEVDGVLKSWAVPKGPSQDPKIKRLAVEVEDHPLEYGDFEGEIPKGEYGAGQVIIWDTGTWQPLGNAQKDLKRGHLDFNLFGKKLKGAWTLIRLKPNQGKNNWLLFKRSNLKAKLEAKVESSQMPKFVKPQLAQAVRVPPRGSEWLHELKYDGYRMLCRIENGKAILLTRSGLDWSKKFSSIISSAEELNLKSAMIDGEIVWLDKKGHSNFQGLQAALMNGSQERLVYYVFDILFLNGEDLREMPLSQRKNILRKTTGNEKSKLIFSEYSVGSGEEILQKACDLKLEGIISKHADDPYSSGRCTSWQKSKCSLRQEMIIGGYIGSNAYQRAFGALLMGVNNKNKLRFVGRVGTGFSQQSLHVLGKKLSSLEIKRPPFANPPIGKDIHWVQPKLVAEVEFKTWTGDKIMRQASFKGLRSDKSPHSVQDEAPGITHPGRIVYKKGKVTKLEVVEYYEAVAEKMLPFMKDRPLSILRCQQDSTGKCFYQKHSDTGSLANIVSKPVYYRDKKDTAISISTKEDLLDLVQAGTLEFHAWNAHFSNITKPDLLVFDLDPDSEKLWPKLIETAFEIRKSLDQLKLRSFVKLTGGKGLHIHVPIQPNYSWHQIKQFSKSLMGIMEEKNPNLYTTNMLLAKRKNRIFLDYLRNGYGATAVLPYSLRARDFPTIAMPISWRELNAHLSPKDYQIRNALRVLKQRADPWLGYWKAPSKLRIFD